MAETLYITGQIQDARHEVACSASAGAGSGPVLAWIVSLRGVYDFAWLTQNLGEFTRLFDNGRYTVLEYEDTTSVTPRPCLSHLVPESIEELGADVTLQAYGHSFTPRSQMVFNGSPESTVFVSTTELTTVVAGATATTPGRYPVQVQTPAPGGGSRQAGGSTSLGPRSPPSNAGAAMT